MAAARDDLDPSDPSDEPSGPSTLPSEDELERTAVPARLRRAPRYRAFGVTGALVAAVLGAVLVLVTGPEGGDPGYALLFVLLGSALIGAVLGGLVAVLLDRR